MSEQAMSEQAVSEQTVSERAMAEGPKPRLILPALGPFYEKVAAWPYPMIRIVAGLNLMPHGAMKLFGWFGGGGIEPAAGFFAKQGYEPGLFWAYAVGMTEFFGGLCLALGLLTRPAALAVAIFLFTAVEYHMPNGFLWIRGGYEYPLLWGVVALAYVFGGGGRFSLDAALGREF